MRRRLGIQNVLIQDIMTGSLISRKQVGGYIMQSQSVRIKGTVPVDYHCVNAGSGED